MWTSDRRRRRALGAALTAALAAGIAIASQAGCGAESGDCLRFSDCALGLTCADGHCVVPPAPPAGDSAAPATTTGEDGGDPDAGDEPTPDDDGSDFDVTTD